MSRPDAADVLAAAAHLDALAAEPRPAGSAAEERARRYCGDRLSALGFRVHEEPFEYSAFPGRWATPVAGALSALALLGAAQLGARGRAGGALAVLAAVLLVIAAGSRWAARRGVLEMGLLRERGVNLVAERGTPRVWLVAHLDSKSQPVPMAARVGGIAGTALVWAAAMALAAWQVLRAADVAPVAWAALSAVGVVAALPVILSLVGARSPGAVDDASGVATVLLAAEWAPADTPLGVVLTSAEELGLAGARAWAVGREPMAALNVDGVDDVGEMRWMASDRASATMVRAVGGARVARLLPGILVDAVALADAGWAAATLSKGTVGTLRRIHTPADARDRLRGDGVAEAGRALAESARRLVRDGPG